MGEPATEVVELPDGVSVEEAIAELQSDPNVAFVEPDYVIRKDFFSDGPGFTHDDLWGMEGDSQFAFQQLWQRRGRSMGGRLHRLEERGSGHHR